MKPETYSISLGRFETLDAPEVQRDEFGLPVQVVNPAIGQKEIQPPTPELLDVACWTGACGIHKAGYGIPTL